jgi:AraC-like DNA-binding protein
MSVPERTVANHREASHSSHELTLRTAGTAGDMVRGYVGYQEWPGKPTTRRRVARPGAALILAFADRIRLRESSETLPLYLGAFVVGPQARSSFTDSDGYQHGVQVELSDAGAVTLFGDVSDLRDATIPIDQALGGQGERLVDQLSDAPAWEARFALLDGFFAAFAARSVSPQVSWLRRELVATGGQARVEPLMDETGWSRRLVTERFRRQFGVSPKTYARIVRFRRTLGMVGRVGRERTLADVATECGYYDQSHFNRDFTALAGCTPSVYLAELAGERDVRFFQDDEPAGSIPCSGDYSAEHSRDRRCPGPGLRGHRGGS